MLSCDHVAYQSLLAHHTELQLAAMSAEGYCRPGKLPGILCQLLVLIAAPGWVQTHQAAVLPPRCRPLHGSAPCGEAPTCWLSQM